MGSTGCSQSKEVSDFYSVVDFNGLDMAFGCEIYCCEGNVKLRVNSEYSSYFLVIDYIMLLTP